MTVVALISIADDIAYENASIALLESFLSDHQADGYAGLLLWVNSGGGSLCVAQDVYAALQRCDIPCVTVIGELCASAAYYVALAARSIVAQPGSLVGGLCASLEVSNYAALHQKLGIRRTVQANGRLKQMLNPCAQHAAEGEEEAIQDILDDLDRQFHDLILRSRPHGKQLQRYFDGRLLSGLRAHQAGLVDSLGGLHEGAQAMAKLLGVASVNVVVIQPEADDEPQKADVPNLLSSWLAAIRA